MIIHDVAQRSEAWFAARSGKLTGTCAKDMLAKIKSGEAAARRDLRYKLIAERLTGISQQDGYVNAVMQWGLDHEAEAIAVYEAATGALVESIGFIEHDTLPVGTSPDGFVGDKGIVSIKCPKTATHISYLRAGTEPSEHAAQNTHELWLSERDWIDFVSYDPRLPDNLKLFIVRITRTPADLTIYNDAARAFLEEVETEVNALRTMTNVTDVLRQATAAQMVAPCR